MTLEDEYRLLVSQRQTEQNLLWSRHNFYLTVNGILLAGFAVVSQSSLTVLVAVITAAGLISSYFWIGTARGALRWTNYYRDLLAEIEQKLENNIKIFCRMQDKYKEFGTGRRLTISIKMLPWVFFISWLVLLLWHVFR